MPNLCDKSPMHTCIYTKRKRKGNYFSVAGIDVFAFSAAALAISLSFPLRTFLRYANNRTKRTSILYLKLACERYELQLRVLYLSFVIMSRPWTKSPFVIWGPIPLKSESAPSCSMM